MSEQSVFQRREFLRSTAVAGAAVSLGGIAGSSLAAEKNDSGQHGWLRKTLKIGMIGVKGSLTDKFKAAKEAGFEGVELNVPGIDVEACKQAAEASGLIIDGTVGGYHWGVRHTDPKPEIRASALEKLKQGLEETAAVGGESMLLVPGHGKDGSDEVVGSEPRSRSTKPCRSPKSGTWPF